MRRLAKSFVLAQLLATAACGPPVEPEESLPATITQMKGTWSYAASLVTATTVGGDSVPCEITGVAITVGDHHASELTAGWPYTFDAETFGGTLECTGTEGFAQDLPVTSVSMARGLIAIDFDFAISTPLGLMELENIAFPGVSDDSIAADYWRGHLNVNLVPLQTWRTGVGQFTAVKR